MTLQTQFDQKLIRLGNSAATVTVDEPPRRVVCSVTECNPLAVSFNELRLETSELASATPERLSQIGTLLSQQLTYLMEPISPIELDADACVVQLRSNPPQRDDDGRSYYELLVSRGGHVSLKRYRKEAGATRQGIVATLTREVLVRLVGDFCVALT